RAARRPPRAAPAGRHGLSSCAYLLTVLERVETRKQKASHPHEGTRGQRPFVVPPYFTAPLRSAASASDARSPWAGSGARGGFRLRRSRAWAVPAAGRAPEAINRSAR